jgi:hypothetical protein
VAVAEEIVVLAVQAAVVQVIPPRQYRQQETRVQAAVVQELIVQAPAVQVVRVLLLLDTQWYKGEKICHIGQK